MSLEAVPTLDEIAAHPERAEGLTLQTRMKLLWRCITVQTAIANTVPVDQPVVQTPVLDATEDRLVGVEEAARLLDYAPATLYRKRRKLPFAVNVGRSVRFSLRGIQKFIKAKQGR